MQNILPEDDIFCVTAMFSKLSNTECFESSDSYIDWKIAILDLAEKVDVLQPFQVKAELIRILQLNSWQNHLNDLMLWDIQQ